MPPTIQDTLLDLFDHVRQNPDTVPLVSLEDWREGSVEWNLLSGFHDMLEQVQQRMHQFRQMEQQLREQEEQYRSIFEAVTDSLTISSLDDGHLVEVNPATCKMLGYSYEELIGKFPAELVPSDYLPVVTEGLQTLRAGGRNDLMMLTLRKDGISFPTEVHSTLFNYKGKPHLLTVSRDITERVQVEEQLREKEEQYRSVFEATDDGLNIANLDGIFIEVNPAFCRMLGYTREELIGMHYSQTTFPEYYAVIEESAQAIESGGQYQTRGFARRKDDSPLPVEAHATPFMYKGKSHMLGVMRDITERVEAENQLREKEEQYRSIFEATYDSLIIQDLDGFLVEVNPAFCRMFGYTRDEIIGLHTSVITAPETLPIMADALETLNAGRNYQTVVVQARRKDGTTFYIEGSGITFTYKGKPHILSVSRDITERVEAERQLREREEQYRSIFEATSDGLIIRDLDGFAVEANPAVCKMHGYSYEEFIGLPRSAIVHPQSHAAVAAYIKAVQQGQTFLGQAIEVRKDGSTFPAEVRGSTFMYLGQPHMLTVLRDITERVEAEQQLREREEQYRGVFEATYDALFIMDLDGFLVEVNPAFCSMFGYPYDEVIGLHASDLTAPVSLPNLDEALNVLKTGKSTQTEMGQGLRKNGTTFYSESQSTTLTYKGKPHALGVVRDIAERVEAERQLREREEQYRSVFEATGDGLIIRDMDGYVVEANPAACSMHGYTYEEFIGLHRNDIIDPTDHSMVAEYMKAIQAGRSFWGQAVDVRKDGAAFPVEVRGSTFTYLGKPHTLSVLRDITERVEAERQLREKEEQYRAVFEATTDGLVILDPEGYYVEANPAMSSLFGYTHEELVGLHTSALTAPESLDVLAMSMEKITGVRGFQAEGLALRKDGTTFYAEAHLTPFTYQGQPHLLAATHDITERVQAQQLLEQRVEERTRELTSLLEISHTVASTLHLNPLLGLILDQLKTVVDYTGAAILVVEGEDLIVLDNRSPIQEVQLMQPRFQLKDLGLIWETMISRETIIMSDVRDDSYLAQAFRTALGELGEITFSYVRACMIVPLFLKEQVIGMLVLTSSKEEVFTSHHSTLALAIANQAAIAIENARLYEQAQALAAIEERQRLARELHDSVSQALYGISLGVHTARMQLDRDPKQVAESLDYVLELADAALVEMRALIFELRPESLEIEGLVTALTKQAAALHARQGMMVQLDLGEEPDLPLKVKQDLYRVAQEALHNTVKHARASQVVLRLEQLNNVVIMEVHDDGRGFDATASFPGHIGLRSMRERVANLGGTFEIESLEGQGTTICIRIPEQGAFQR